MTESKLQKQKQFGQRLFWLIVIVLVIFVGWYLYEKSGQNQKNTEPTQNSQSTMVVTV